MKSVVPSRWGIDVIYLFWILDLISTESFDVYVHNFDG